jgi:serine/threonine protein kinase
MVQMQNEGQTWWLAGKLSPSIFTENYLYQNQSGRRILMREINSIFQKFLSRDDDYVKECIEEANLRGNKNYSKMLLSRKEEAATGEIWRTYEEFAPYKLFDLINKTDSKRIDEKIARYYLVQILNALEELHLNCVFYISLRLEDLTLDQDYNLKLNNYGIPHAIIRCSQNLDWVSGVCQKNGSLSPEIVAQSCSGEKSDIFNLGVVLFSMVTGFRPFKEINSVNDFLYKCIQNNDALKYWQFIKKSSKIELSKEFKDLILKMLSPDYLKRISLAEIKTHPWMNMNANEIVTPDIIFNFFNNHNHNQNNNSNNLCSKNKSKINENKNKINEKKNTIIKNNKILCSKNNISPEEKTEIKKFIFEYLNTLVTSFNND